VSRPSRPSRPSHAPLSLPPPGRYPTLVERFWNFLQSTGSRSPGCSRTPGPPYGTGHTVNWPQKGTPIPK
jgi:hypothetical protein